MKKLILLLTIALLVMLNSCAVAKISGRGAVPIMLNQSSEKMELVEHISVEKNSNFDYTNTYDVSDVIAESVAAKKPDAVINTNVVLRQGVDNYFMNLFTLGFARSIKVCVEADLMKEKK